MDYQHGQPGPPRYVMLSEQTSVGGGVYVKSDLRPPPGRRNLPRYHSGAPREKSSSYCCSCGCLCWCCLFLFIIIIFLAGAAAYIFFVLDPKPPSYNVSNLDVGEFKLNTEEFSVSTRIVAFVRAENPNANIGIYYGSGSRVAVVYRNLTLCAGHLPNFYQGHNNVTIMKVVMEGRAQIGSGIEKALEESQHSGSIPIDVYVKVPVALRLAGAFDLREVTVNVDCMLVVDSLTAGKKTGIKSTKYKVNVEF